MTMMISARFDGKAFIPDGPVPFRKNQSVTLHVDAKRSKPLSDKPSAAEVKRRKKAFAELLKLSAKKEEGIPPADCSRDSIYSGTLDDTR